MCITHLLTVGDLVATNLLSVLARVGYDSYTIPAIQIYTYPTPTSGPKPYCQTSILHQGLYLTPGTIYACENFTSPVNYFCMYQFFVLASEDILRL